MPQLDTVYALTTYLWTWLNLCLIMQKIKTLTMTTHPQKTPAPNKTKPPLQWL